MGTWAEEMDSLMAEVVGSFGDEVTVRRVELGEVNQTTRVAPRTVTAATVKANVLPAQGITGGGGGGGGGTGADAAEVRYSIRSADLPFVPRRGDEVTQVVKDRTGGTVTVVRYVVRVDHECSRAGLMLHCRQDRPA